MRLIDADKLKERFTDEDNPCGIQTVILDAIDLQPTAYDVDNVLRQCKDKAIELMNIQYNEDEYHMFSKGVQAMYLGVEKIIKENKIYSEIDVDMCINCTKSKYSNQGRPYCAKEERHLASFSYKPDWCPLKAGGIDENKEDN